MIRLKLGELLALGVTLLTLAGAGCKGRFDGPLVDVRSAKLDKRLLGSWSALVNDKSGLLKADLRVQKSPNSSAETTSPGQMRAQFSFKRLNGAPGPHEVSDFHMPPTEFVVTRIGSHSYMSTLEKDRNGKVGSSISAYDIKGDTLELKNLDDSLIDDLVKSKQIEETGTGDGRQYSASSFAKYLEAHPNADLFSPWLVFQRSEPPPKTDGTNLVIWLYAAIPLAFILGYFASRLISKRRTAKEST